MFQRFPQYYDELSRLVAARTPFVSITLVHARGHTPQGAGAKALVGAHGLLAGTVGGGLVEARAIEHARRLLALEPAPGEPPKLHDFVTWNLQQDVDMSCGGEVSFYFEVVFRHEWELVIFGAGHVAQKLIPVLLTLDCSIRCVDTRADWIERLPRSPKLHASVAAELAAEAASVSEGAFVLLLTQGHGHDVPILLELFRLDLLRARPNRPYVGVIGSDVKGQALRQELREAGIPAEACEAIRCPMGLPFGTNDPAEIAVSVAGELLSARDRLRGSRWA